MRKKFLISLSAALAMSIALPVASYADEWRRDSRGWWYEIDDDDDNFINEISMMTAVEFAKAKNEEYDKMIKSKEES